LFATRRETCRRGIVLVQKRRDTRFCSLACRQRAYRQRKAAEAKPSKAHQRLIGQAGNRRRFAISTGRGGVGETVSGGRQRCRSARRAAVA
jgi:hypothetical protein